MIADPEPFLRGLFRAAVAADWSRWLSSWAIWRSKSRGSMRAIMSPVSTEVAARIGSSTTGPPTRNDSSTSSEGSTIAG